MKVLLMVEREGRVVSVGGAFPEYMWRRGGEKIHELYRDTVGLGPVRLAFMYGKWAASLLASDRWWLVEAEGAEAARKVIAGRVQCVSCFAWFDKASFTANHICYAADPRKRLVADPLGRILASGGRS